MRIGPVIRSMTAVIQTPRLLLSPYVVEDVPALAEVMGNVAVMRHIGKGALDFDEVSATVARAIQHWKDTGMGWWSIKLTESDRLIGQICLKPATDLKEIEVGYALNPVAWGKGYGDEALRAVLHYATNARELTRVVATVRPENTHSIGLLSRCGFKFESDLWLRDKVLHLYVFPSPASIAT